MLHKILGNPVAWDLSRYLLDLTCGLYKKRNLYLRNLRIFKDNPSVLDIGCGTGLFANITNGYYVGIDSDVHSINRAQRKQYNNKKIFRCVDLNTLQEEGEMFDVVLIADVLHHLNDQECDKLFKTTAKITRKYLVSFDAVLKKDLSVLQKWFVRHDKGEYFRYLDDFNRLFCDGGFNIVEYKDIPLGYLSTHFTLCCPDRATAK
jgi:SAM-dependent methyltransferase